MQKEQMEWVEQGLGTAFLDESISSNIRYKPQFISNDFKRGSKVLAFIEKDLSTCEKFYISVAFITMGGITPLLQTLRELEKRGIEGCIMTTNYLHFSEPQAIRMLSTFKNIKIKMFMTSEAKVGFHTKGYIFKKEEIYHIIVGSSNMTLSALTTNREWNTRLISCKQGEYTKDIISEFFRLWDDPCTLDFEKFIDVYEKAYLENKSFQKREQHTEQGKMMPFEERMLKPNSMQNGFIANLHNLRKAGEKRALLISATGTGKTYASAFALQKECPKRALFLVHREQIAKQAMISYKKVFGDIKTFALLSGNSQKEEVFEADYLFSTMNMMAKSEIYRRFKPNEFHTIIIDEAHRIGSASYQNIMSYFEPEFWLGMTASPERTDDFDVFEAFDHNIAYEIRLQKAMEEDLLCPFHYFGITDLQIEGQVVSEKTDFNKLTSDVRVDYVIEQMEFYGYSGDRVKGLVFCSSKKEAIQLSKMFNERNYKTIALTGKDSQEQREQAIERLVSESEKDKIDYIFTVDIFNEGVDIPEINQVVMLRPTKSPIVFVQQLGRGLRKAKNKEYVVILDFIGNYDNNFMIPIALSGDRSYNKDNIRRYLMEGCRMLPGASTIHFDEIAKNRIFHSIDRLKGIKAIIRKGYRDLKSRLGRVPLLIDFYNNGEVDPLVILEQYKSYPNFLKSVDEDAYSDQLLEKEFLVLEYLSKIVARGKRPHEAEILEAIMNRGHVKTSILAKEIAKKYRLNVSIQEIESAVNNLQGNFVSKEEELKKYSQIDILQKTQTDQIQRMVWFYDRLNYPLFHLYMNDLIEISKARFRDLYAEKPREDEFVLYEKYSRRDVCQLLNERRDLSSTMYGMKRIGEDVCIFVTYHKQETTQGKEYLEGKPNYADEFVNNQIFMWDSQMGKGPDSSYMQEVLQAKRKRLFVKKSDSEGADFYYMGLFDVVEAKPGKKKDNHGKVRVITKVKVRMQQEVRQDLLEYLQETI